MTTTTTSASPPIRTLLLAVALSQTLACVDGGEPEGGDGVTFGSVRAVLGGGIEGVDLCEKGTENCTVSDAEGKFELGGLEEDVDFVLSIEEFDHFPAAGMFHTSRAADRWRFLLPTDEELQAQLSFANEEIVRGAGQVFFAAAAEKGDDKPGVPGVTLTPEDDSDALGTPVYANAAGIPSTAESATTGAGNAIFINVEPGTYHFAVEGADCEPYFSLNSPDNVVYTVHVYANTLSTVTTVCTPN
jgi:hypothetical protein